MNNEDELFTFAVIADTHIKPEQQDESSPYQANQLSIGRSRYLVRMLDQLSPDFVIHMGDLVHPIPTLPTHDKAVNIAERFF